MPKNDNVIKSDCLGEIKYYPITKKGKASVAREARSLGFDCTRASIRKALSDERIVTDLYIKGSEINENSVYFRIWIGYNR